KTGLVDFARALQDAGWSLVSTGGTLAALTGAGLEATAVEEVTGFPELLDGRVKTLHPRVHAGVLARDTDGHRAELEEHGIEAFDLVVANLYPFRETAGRADAGTEEIIENIDIGGPALIRAAAKTHERVLVVVDPADYAAVLTGLADGKLSELRRPFARKAFAHTAAYDSAIVSWFDEDRGTDADSLHLTLERAAELRYGENPHQQAALYREEGKSGWWDGVTQHKGSGLSYLNVFDADAAWGLVHEFDEPACVIVKHANPCGVAVRDTVGEAYRLAFDCDPRSAFGGIVAFNREVDGETAAQIMGNAKADVLIAPAYTAEALELLNARRKAMRVLEARPPGRDSLELRRVDGGYLVQERDTVQVGRDAWKTVTEREPSAAELADMAVAWTVCAWTGSNAIVLVKDGVAWGIGAGQQSRVDSAEIAAQKAAGRARGGACASDAFYPFRDGLDAAAAAGATAVVQPGGSVRDDEVTAAADEHDIAMVFTGR
ncbi:MAG TPA: bifunctional phosphoribosylaminoimidazolecarboxamide formyltransferase/IMP cyclohydrolase, partial [Deinococcales bacterium]|nr:bifunctional phosphoribosylaminoimidazolecarboxamide formyltransferase/IMP cyclohydrolase [Deinococcales bacterium]